MTTKQTVPHNKSHPPSWNQALLDCFVTVLFSSDGRKVFIAPDSITGPILAQTTLATNAPCFQNKTPRSLCANGASDLARCYRRIASSALAKTAFTTSTKIKGTAPYVQAAAIPPT